MSTTIKYFAYAHLPAALQVVSKPIGDLAHQLEAQLPEGAEKSAGMRKLLEAKDCFVRAALDAPKQEPQAVQLPPHQQRVVVEASDLDERLQKLSAFIDGDAFKAIDSDEQARLVTQAGAMASYLAVLQERISNFVKE